MAKAFDWNRSCSYDDAQKKQFHSNASKCLRRLADALKLSKDSYEIRSNKAGIAVSGEITLHHDQVYVQVAQFAFGAPDQGIMIRTCDGRSDYTGGPNNFVALDMLDDIDALAKAVRRVQPSLDGEIDHDHADAPHPAF